MGSCSSRTNIILPKPNQLKYSRHSTIKRLSFDLSGRYQFKPKTLLLPKPSIAKSFKFSTKSMQCIISLCSLPQKPKTKNSFGFLNTTCFCILDEYSLLMGFCSGKRKYCNHFNQYIQSKSLFFTQQQKKDPVQLIAHLTSESYAYIIHDSSYEIPFSQSLVSLQTKTLNFSTTGSCKILVASDKLRSQINEVQTNLNIIGSNRILKTRKIPPSCLLPYQISSVAINKRKSDKLNPIIKIKHMINSTGFLTDTNSINTSRQNNSYSLKSYFIDSQDQFVVIADKAIWQVMMFKEVVDFIENYRKFCKSDLNQYTGNKPSVRNSCVAHLLCEQARLRWLAVYGKKKVALMDIGCIVIEFLNNIGK